MIFSLAANKKKKEAIYIASLNILYIFVFSIVKDYPCTRVQCNFCMQPD